MEVRSTICVLLCPDNCILPNKIKTQGVQCFHHFILTTENKTHSDVSQGRNHVSISLSDHEWYITDLPDTYLYDHVREFTTCGVSLFSGRLWCGEHSLSHPEDQQVSEATLIKGEIRCKSICDPVV